MSRNHVDFTPDIHVVYGVDHALGNYVDIYDTRYAGTEGDEQGEGFVLEWCEMFGLTTNLINAPKDMFILPINLQNHKDELIRLCNEFAKVLE